MIATGSGRRLFTKQVLPKRQAFACESCMKELEGSMSQEQGTQRSAQWGVLLLLLIAVIAFFLLTDHRAHLFEFLPYLLLLACPFMHFFMHRGHVKHGSH
jgi:hypothetical protein